MSVRSLLKRMLTMEAERESMTKAREELRLYLAGEDPESEGCRRLQRLENKFTEELERLTADRCQLEAALDRMRTPVYRDILLCRYRDGMSWEEMGAELDMELRWVFRRHRRALAELESVWEEDARKKPLKLRTRRRGNRRDH